MRKKRIGLLFGMEDTFPWALINTINTRGLDVEATPVEISYLKDDGVFEYDLILDRISHEVPFYRTMLKCAAASGVRIVNNPIWWSADDKFFDNLVAKSAGVAVPRTVLLPHKQYPPNTEAKSFRNMKWVEWQQVFDTSKAFVAACVAKGGDLLPYLGTQNVAFQIQADAPSCAECGSIMVRNGSCYKCLNCGSTSGCS